MRYVIEPRTGDDGKTYEIAVYTPDAEERDHVAVTVKHPLAADVITGMLTTSYAAGEAGRSLDATVIADAMAYLLAPWGEAVSDRGLRTEVADAHKAGLAARDTTTTPVKDAAA